METRIFVLAQGSETDRFGVFYERTQMHFTEWLSVRKIPQ